MVMSRKAKLTIYRDRLEAISMCPSTIFNNFEPSDDDFDTVRRAEAGDLAAIEAISSLLFNIYSTASEPNSALIYFLSMGLANGSAECAAKMIRVIDRFNTEFSRLSEAIEIVAGTDSAALLSDVIADARLKGIIAAAKSPECDFKELSARVDLADTELKCAILLYLAASALRYTGECDREAVQILAESLGLSSLASLQILGGDGVAKETDTERELAHLKRILNAIDMREWRDLWLAVLYEYARLYLDSDLSKIADTMLAVINSRPEYRDKSLHVLAVKRYMLNRGIGSSDEECEALDKLCRFRGLYLSEPYDDLIHDAIYSGGSDGVTHLPDGSSHVSELYHERNRYNLTMTLTGHKKRAARHQWDCIISLRTDEDVAPIFREIPITERRAEISRNGITYGKEKKAAQVICQGEIQLGERLSPIELDLIVDISYVSTTKCTHAMIRVERVKREGEYLVMLGDVSLYNESSNK